MTVTPVPGNLAKSRPTARLEDASVPDIQPEAVDLLAWYGRHARVLLWRAGPADRRIGIRPDPYRVWLSEIMLQQTTVKAVAPYFHRFVDRWPNVRALASADDNVVMAAWAGLGYYARARNLIACARLIAFEREGRFPDNAIGLAKLPGVGAYTAAAIAAIAFDEAVPVVDGNVERVVTRLFAIDTPLPAAKATVRERVARLVPSEHAGEFAEAMMDLGATICTPQKPACSLCPWCEPCEARRTASQNAFPVKAGEKVRPKRRGQAFVVRRADGAILLRRRPASGLLGGMAEVPGTEWSESGPLAAVPPLAAEWISLAAPVKHVFTHFELTLSVQRAEAGEDTPTPSDHWWSPPEALPHEALPSLMKKVIEAAYPGATKPVRPAR